MLHAPPPKLSLHESVLRRMQSIKRYRDSFQFSADRGLLELLSGSFSLASASKYIVKGRENDAKTVDTPQYVIRNITSPHFGEEFEVQFPASRRGTNLSRSYALGDLRATTNSDYHDANEHAFASPNETKRSHFASSCRRLKTSKPIVRVTTWDGDLV